MTFVVKPDDGNADVAAQAAVEAQLRDLPCRPDAGLRVCCA